MDRGLEETSLYPTPPCLVPSLLDKLAHHPPEPPPEEGPAGLMVSSECRSDVTSRSGDMEQWHPSNRSLKTAVGLEVTHSLSQ